MSRISETEGNIDQEPNEDVYDVLFDFIPSQRSTEGPTHVAEAGPAKGENAEERANVKYYRRRGD